MNKELIDRAWACLPREFKEEVKKQYDIADDSEYTLCTLEYLFGYHNITSDADGEDEMLCVSRKEVQEIYTQNQSEITRENVSSSDKDCYEYANEVLKTLFGFKCLPDNLSKNSSEIKQDLSKNSSEPTPAEQRFKVGDKVRIVNDISHINKYNGDITEIVYVDESDPNMPYKVDIYDEEFGGGLWYQESDLEPYTEPEASTCTDGCPSPCPSPCPSQDFDNILKDSFRNERRLHIAAMAMQGILSNIDLFKNVLETGMETLGGDDISYRAVAKASFLFADALIKKVKGGSDE